VPAPDPITRTSPLQGLAGPVVGITLEERAFVGKVNLRGDPEDATFLQCAAGAIGTHLPLRSNSTASGDGRVTFWCGPDEWLVHTPEDGQEALVEALQGRLGGLHTSVTDVSDQYTVIRLWGAEARRVLAKAGPLDLHPSVFRPGDCAQSLYANAAILIHQVDEGPTYDLQVRWSFAEHLWRFLTDAAHEFS